MELKVQNQSIPKEVEKLILETLQTTANNSVSNEQIIASLDRDHSLNVKLLNQKLSLWTQLILSCMCQSAIHRGDPKELLDIESVLKDLRKEIQRPNF